MIDFLPGSAKARKMVGLAFLSQNCATGMLLGSYGALISEIEATFNTSRAMSSLGIALVSVTVALLSPVIGLLLRRVSLRGVLVAGGVVNALGYALLATVTNITSFILVLVLLVGTGVALMGVIAPATLVSRWYRTARGRALGLINMPIFLILMPPLAARVVNDYGMSTWFLCAAAMFVLLGLLMLMVIDEPEKAGETAFGALPVSEETVEQPLIGIAALAANPQFWLLSLGIALSTGVAKAFLTHAIPFAQSAAIPIQSAALLVTVFGAAGILGNVSLGWLSDRVGASVALSVSAMGQALLWAALPLVTGFPMLMGVAALLGMFSTSIIALHGAAVNELFGHRNLSSVMGFGYPIKLPFLFGATSLAGYLFDVTGGYRVPFLAFSFGLLVVTVGFIALSFLHRRRQQPVSAVISK